MAFLETMAKLIERYNSFFTEGIVNTLIIAAFSVLFGAILGTLMASLRMCRIPPLRWIAVAYIEFVRGTPLMVQLMFIFYGLPMIGITDLKAVVQTVPVVRREGPVRRRYRGYEHEQLRLCGGDHPLRYSGCGRRTDGGRPERWLQQR